MAPRVTWLADTNIWLALVLSHHLHHDAAAAWLDEVDEPESIVLCRSVQQSLLRLLTTAAVFTPYGNRPLSNDQALDVVDALVADDRMVLVPTEPPGLDAHWVGYARRPTSSPKLWMDAYLAAFARASGHTLVTTDTGFTQFEALDVRIVAA